MPVVRYLEKLLADGICNYATFVEVAHESDGSTFSYMSVEDTLDSGSDFLYQEYISTDKLEDGTIYITVN